MLDICRETGGAVEDITDDEVRDGIVLLARTEGIFTETAGGTTVGVLKKLVETGQLDTTLETVVINTGHGLKTLDAVSEPGRPGRDHRAVVRRLRRPTGLRPSEPEHHPHDPEATRVSVSVRVPTILRTYTGGESEVSAEGATLAEVLDDLDAELRRHPGPDPRRRRQRCAASSTSTSATTTSASSTTWPPRPPTAPRSRSSRRSPAADRPGRGRRCVHRSRSACRGARGPPARPPVTGQAPPSPSTST